MVVVAIAIAVAVVLLLFTVSGVLLLFTTTGVLLLFTVTGVVGGLLVSSPVTAGSRGRGRGLRSHGVCSALRKGTQDDAATQCARGPVVEGARGLAARCWGAAGAAGAAIGWGCHWLAAAPISARRQLDCSVLAQRLVNLRPPPRASSRYDPTTA